MTSSSRNAAQRRYQRRVLIASLAYVVTLLVEHRLFAEAAPVLLFALALLPALSIVAVFVALGAYLVEEQDEFLRMRIVRQIVWGTGIAISAGTLWGFPEDAGLLPKLPFYFIAIFWFAGFGIAGIASKVLDR